MSDGPGARRVLPGRLAMPPADLLRALSTLQPRDEPTLAAILDTLGYALSQEEDPRLSSPVPPRVLAERRLGKPKPVNDAVAKHPVRMHQPSDISRSEPTGAAMPDWMIAAVVLSSAHDPGAVFRVPIQPLLAPGRERALLVHAAAQRLRVGEIDLERVVDAIAIRKPLKSLPRRRVTSPRDGVQLLCDCGPGMDPFALDVEQLIRAVLGVAGRDRVSVAHFVGCPSRGLLRWWDTSMRPYRPPPPGQPVLVLSDLGMVRAPGCGPPASIAEWLAFASLLRRRGSQITIMFPGAAERFPLALLGPLRLLSLDRGTGVRDAATGRIRVSSPVPGR